MRPRTLSPRQRTALDLLGPLALVGLAAVIGLGGSAAFQRTMISILANLAVVIGIYVFIGNSGILSFGHIGFMSLGAFTSALVTIPAAAKSTLLPSLPGFIAGAQVGLIPSMLIAALVAAVVALLIGIPILKTSTLAIPVSTLAFLLIVFTVENNWTAVTRGPSPLFGIPTDATIPLAAGWCAVAVVLAYVYQRSAGGLRLKSSREDEIAAGALGVDVFRERLLAFVFSAALVAAAGAIAVHQIGVITADSFYINTTVITLAMLVFGGIRSLFGAVVGSLLISAVLEVLRGIENGAQLGPFHVSEHPGLAIIGLMLIMLAVLILRPSGLTGGRELSDLLVRRGQATPDPGSGSPTSVAGPGLEPRAAGSAE